MIPFNSSILITGAGGFIGGYFTRYLNDLGYHNLILVDNFSKKRIEEVLCSTIIERELLFSWLNVNQPKIDFVIHLGARADTTETEKYIFDHLNVQYSKQLFEYCADNEIPIIYASSAATYGDGSLGFNEDAQHLKPLNEYAKSKNKCDKIAPYKMVNEFWAGLKFFNVYGPGEYIKGKMASMVNHGYKQAIGTGKINLFKSYNGDPQRDFVYVKDVCNVIYWMMNNKPASGIYNLGTGVAKSFNDLARAIFKALGQPEQIEYIDMPEALQKAYQYYTCADMSKLRAAGYNQPFTTLEEGVKEYLSYIYKDNEWHKQ